MWIAVIGVGGTVFVALLGQVVQIVHAGRQRKWSREDLQAAHDHDREARLFEHKQTAYTEFLSKYESFYNSLFEHVEIMNDFPGTDYDTFDGLYSKWVRVSMYGSQETADRAMSLIQALGNWADSPRGERSAELESAREQFMRALRRDLGVEKPASKG